MRDADVRAAVRLSLRSVHEGDPDTIIVEEMGVWSGSARVDVAVINGELQGIELKSTSDTLERLPAQQELYGRIFDRLTLVVATKHYDRAVQLVPAWWGLTIAASVSDSVNLLPLRGAQLNPSLSPFHVARLLWREESLECLSRCGGTRGLASKSSDRLAEALSDRLPLDKLRSEVRTKLKRRSSWLRQDGDHLR